MRILHNKKLYRIMHGDVPSGVSVNPFASSLKTLDVNKRVETRLFLRVHKDAAAELMNSTFRTPASFAASANSAVILSLLQCSSILYL